MEEIKEIMKDWIWEYASMILLVLSLTLSGTSFMMSIIALTLVLEAMG